MAIVIFCGIIIIYDRQHKNGTNRPRRFKYLIEYSCVRPLAKLLLSCSKCWWFFSRLFYFLFRVICNSMCKLAGTFKWRPKKGETFIKIISWSHIHSILFNYWFSLQRFTVWVTSNRHNECSCISNREKRKEIKAKGLVLIPMLFAAQYSRFGR